MTLSETPSGPEPAPKPEDDPRIGGFEALSVVGSGGSGTVYRARDVTHDREVALKVVRGMEGTHISRFEREADLHTRLDHPNIVRAFRWGREKDVGWIAFELLEGADLSRYIRSQMSFERRLGILGEVSRALHYGHEQGVIHRDVKPANIFIRRDGRISLLDFGVAKLPDKPLTATGRLVGTPAYMAPEYILETPVDRRADVFGLGVVAFQLLSGTRPWTADEAHTLLVRICTTPAARFEENLAGAPVEIPAALVPALGAVIHRALAHDPNRRHANALELARDFESLASGRSVEDTWSGMAREAPASDRLAWARARAARIQAEASHEDAPHTPSERSIDLTARSQRAFWTMLTAFIVGVVVLLAVALAGLS